MTSTMLQGADFAVAMWHGQHFPGAICLLCHDADFSHSGCWICGRSESCQLAAFVQGGNVVVPGLHTCLLGLSVSQLAR